jgi:uncharacterized protein (TIGR02145 family)
VRTKFIIGLILLFPLFGVSQGEWNQWRFGVNAGLDFNFTPPAAVTNSAIQPFESVSQADSLGNLLFYSNGQTVWNKNNAVMQNGTGLYGFTLTQTIFLIPDPGNSSQYYLFTVGPWTYYPPRRGLYYSKIDMTLAGGLGGVIAGMKNIPVPGGENVPDGIYGTRHRNNKDAWLVARSQSPQVYLSYLITSAGFNTTPVISPSQINCIDPPTSYPSVGIRISQDGDKMIATYAWSDSTLNICHFDNSTGKIEERFKIPVIFMGIKQPAGQFEFSKNSYYIYSLSILSPWTPPPHPNRIVLQYHINISDSAQFMQSQMLIDSTHIFSGMFQLGPDDKIYFGENTVDSLGVINNPNMPGAGCNFQINAISLSGKMSTQQLPVFLQRYKAYFHHAGDCPIDPVNFTSDIWPPPDSIRWNFGDPASSAANTSTLANPSHSFTSSGNHVVELYVRHNDNRRDTTWQTITILPAPQPALGPDQTICAPQTATFDAGACTGCTYLWDDLTNMITNIGTGQTYTTGTAGLYRVTVTGPNGCTGGDTVQLSIGTPVAVSVTIATGSTTVCAGTQVTFTSNATNAGGSPGYQWKVNSVNAANATNTTFTYTPVNGDCVVCEVTTGDACAIGSPATSNQICMTVNPFQSVSVTISTPSTHTCAYVPVTFNAFPVNPGNGPVYQWKVNGVNTGTNNQLFTYTPVNGDCVTCELTSDINCPTGNPALSDTICMTVDQPLPVSVSVTTPLTTICAGTPVTFTANASNGGSTPQYQWKVNAINAGNATNSTYTYTPLTGDVVTCQLASSDNCVSGNPAMSPAVIMTVAPLLPVSVTVTTPLTTVCAGTSVTFTANVTNGGNFPGYQWKVNATNASNASNSTYTYVPANGDLVSCVLTAAGTCITGSPANSQPVTLTVTPSLPVSVAIAASVNPFCQGTAVTFTAAPTNGGLSPSYQWKLNGVNAGTNSTVFTCSPTPGDSIRCVITSNLNCVTGNPASSGKVIMSANPVPNVSFTSCFDTVTIFSAKPFKLKGGLPPGGQYTGPGVNSSTEIFNPSVAGTGLKTIQYSYSNVYTCLSAKTKTILVQPVPSFICGNNLTDIRDNKVYRTVQIGTQCWFRDNLNFGTQISDLIPQTDNCTAEKYVHNSIFYQWDELMLYSNSEAVQGLCPPGWHIPSSSEWNALLTFYDDPGQAGGPMKDHLLSNGFDSYQQGFFYLNNLWSFTTGLYAGSMYWTSTLSGSDYAVARGFNEYNTSVSMYPASRGNAFSVRCLKDSGN